MGSGRLGIQYLGYVTVLLLNVSVLRAVVKRILWDRVGNGQVRVLALRSAEPVGVSRTASSGALLQEV